MWFYFRWRDSNGTQILNSPYLSTGRKLKFDKLSPRFTSNYTCVAENMAGSRMLTVQIVVTGEFDISFLYYITKSGFSHFSVRYIDHVSALMLSDSKMSFFNQELTTSYKNYPNL